MVTHDITASEIKFTEAKNPYELPIISCLLLCRSILVVQSTFLNLCGGGTSNFGQVCKWRQWPTQHCPRVSWPQLTARAEPLQLLVPSVKEMKAPSPKCDGLGPHTAPSQGVRVVRGRWETPSLQHKSRDGRLISRSNYKNPRKV